MACIIVRVVFLDSRDAIALSRVTSSLIGSSSSLLRLPFEDETPARKTRVEDDDVGRYSGIQSRVVLVGGVVLGLRVISIVDNDGLPLL